MYKKILVPLDGSEVSENVLGHVKAIARGCQVKEVVLLQVVEPLLISFKSTITMADRYREEVDKYEQSIEDYLGRVAGTLKKGGLPAKTVMVRITHGSVADEILNYATENGVDLIVMSTHGKSGLSRWHFGSVANRVSSHSTVPVLIVTPSGFRTG
ncbi:MAG: universal stress protein [Dehalococcoidales bacterium]|nr:universal stress protein [Dehalococcoidales bacterium]